MSRFAIVSKQIFNPNDSRALINAQQFFNNSLNLVAYRQRAFYRQITMDNRFYLLGKGKINPLV